MRNDHIKSYLKGRLFAVCPSYMAKVTDVLNNGEVARVETNDDISPSHSYEVKDNLAIITIDGVTVAKNTFMNAISGGYIGYDTLIGYAQKAENDPKITDILYHINTRGGDVEGVDRFGELIENSSKTTHTFYSSVGASAGVWYGTASDHVYAEEMAVLGSIGVMAMMSAKIDDKDEDTMVIVSENAENKNCSLNGDCKEKIIKAINSTEAIFYSRVIRNTGMSKEDIKTVFNNGDTISAKEALDANFIEKITTFDKVVKSLVVGTVPDLSKPVANQTKKEIIMADENQPDLVALDRARTAEIAALGQKHGISATVVQAAMTDGTKVVAFKDIALAAQSTTISALEKKLEVSINAQGSDGAAIAELEEQENIKAEQKKTDDAEVQAELKAASQVKV